MKKTSFLMLTTLIIAGFIFSACQAKTNKPSEITNEAQTTNAQLNEPKAVISKDDGLDTLEQELKETKILEEDFGDLDL